MDVNANEDPTKTPLRALGPTSNTILRSLNSTKVLMSEDGIYRDWRGVAYLAGICNLYDSSSMNDERDPIAKVLSLWRSSKDSKQAANFDNLLKILGQIDRWDVADDLMESLAEDAKAYQNQLSIARQKASAACNAFENDVCGNFPLESDENILTDDDSTNHSLGLPPQKYDAYVLFADEDIEFALELVRNMEQDIPNFGFKLCYKERDLLPGAIQNEAIMRLIRERCDRLIVIFSQAFLKSPSNKFFTSFATALQIEQRRRKIIPCLIEHCTLPITVDLFSNLKYYNCERLYNFWERLSKSIRNPIPYRNGNINAMSMTPLPSFSVRIEEIREEQAQRAITSGAPVKIPRKRSSKLPDTIEFAPEPCLRAAASCNQLSLAAHDNKDYCRSECDLSSVGSCDGNVSSTKSSRSGKTKWYKLLLPSRSVSSRTDLSEDSSVSLEKSNKKEKRKLKWLKK